MKQFPKGLITPLIPAISPQGDVGYKNLQQVKPMHLLPISGMNMQTRLQTKVAANKRPRSKLTGY